MSLLPPSTASGRRRHRSQDESLHMTLGRSMNGDMQRSLGSKQQGVHVKAFSESDKVLPPPPQFVSKLPPAVASVPLEDVRSYVHSKRVTHYQIGSTLGEGSFAKVKEGFHVLVGEKVAVKVIDKKKAQQDPYVSKNFRREAKLLQMVHHPNILQLLEVVETDNSYYLITELCSGGDLMNYIYKKKQLDEKETRKYMRQMVSAVDHLHKAGIIHRDLKVENLLLDVSGNIKIIDFGLSNEEYVMEAGGRVHCSTQCGSPAYAAPELLGHKPYGPEVDIWSLGVNMYAMLTGCLPYTVEPFNITALHAKMLENKMNPIPSTLSKECSDLLQRLLTSEPALRIKMPELMAHTWMTEGNSALKPHPFPNKLCANDINEDIVEHMVHVLKLKEREEDVTVELLADRACATCAIYNLLLARLNRYNQQNKPKVKLRKKSRYASPVSTVDDDDDAHSMISCPPRTMRDNRAPLRPVTRDSKLHQVTEESGTEEDNTRLRQRRRTLPSELMKEDIAKIRQNQHYSLPPVQSKAGTLPRSLRNRPDTTLQPHRGGHEVTEISRPPTHLNPVRPPPMRRRSVSHHKDLHKLKQDLNRHGAWNSQPSSQASSLAGSRNPSRKPSASSRQSMTHHRLSGSEFDNDLEFHHVDTVTDTSPSKHTYTSHSQRIPLAPIDSSDRSDNSVHFPSITSRSSRNTHQRTSREVYHSTSNKHYKNGYWSATEQYEFRTEKAVSTILHDLQKALGDLNIACTGSDQKTHTINLRYQNIAFTVHVDKDHLNTCQLHFHWLKGGTQEQYKDLCSQIFRSLC